MNLTTLSFIVVMKKVCCKYLIKYFKIMSMPFTPDNINWHTHINTVIPLTLYFFCQFKWSFYLSRSNNPLSADAPDLTNFSSVEEWLNSIKMARYLENFHAGGIKSMDAVVNLTVKELTDLGITLVGHQKKLWTVCKT